MRKQTAKKQPGKTTGLYSLPYELFWKIFEAGGKDVIRVTLTGHLLYLYYRTWQIREEFKANPRITTVPNVQVILRKNIKQIERLYWSLRCNHEYKIKPSNDANTFQLYTSLHLLSSPPPKKYDSEYQQASTTLETYKENHPNVGWVLSYLSTLHLNKYWEDANKTKGLEYGKAAIKLNNVRTCILWTKDCENKSEELLGIQQLKTMALQNNPLAIRALVFVFLHGTRDIIKPNMPTAKWWNTKLNTLGDHSVDKIIQIHEKLPTASC